MSKAILVIDMPSSCIECPYSMLEANLCLLNKDVIFVKDGDISKNCPLKPMPQKKVLDEELFMTGNFKLVYARFTGWNDCIDEILGGEYES